MKPMRILFAAVFMMLIWIAPTEAQRSRPKTPRIQIAILLDTSSSMSGLIDQARREIWGIVNEMSQLGREGKQARLEVALYEYGNSRLKPETGFIRQVLPLTTDLDRLSEELFLLTVSGGSEYCGQVILEATRSLQWSAGREDLKIMIIAGNEPFTQGPVDYREAIRQASARGILVNTIYCGDYETGVRGLWKDAAMLADARYLAIDHNLRELPMVAPQDQDLARLNQALNRTYLPFGHHGIAAAARQEQQDVLSAAAAPSAFAERALSKSSRIYRNDTWDLVDAVTHQILTAQELIAMDANQLPASMQKLKPEARMSFIEKTLAERQTIQAKIRELVVAREAFITEARRKSEEPAKKGFTLREAILQAVREQAAARKFTSLETLTDLDRTQSSPEVVR